MTTQTEISWNQLAPQAVALDALNRFQWSVFPLDAGKQPPIIPGKTKEDGSPMRMGWKKYQKERANEALVTRWQTVFQPSAWAIIAGALSNKIILDFDGEKGYKTLELLGLNPHVRTGSGGYHVYFKHPGWYVPTLNSKSKIDLGKRWPGLDIRGDGGYAAFCGSNASGQYTWLRNPEEVEEVSILPDALRDFLGLLHAPLPQEKKVIELRPQQMMRQTGQSIADICLEKALDRAANGRDDACFWLAQQLHDNDYSQAEAENICEGFARRTHTTNTKGAAEPFTEADARAKVASAYSYPSREPWSQRTQEQETRRPNYKQTLLSVPEQTMLRQEIQTAIQKGDAETLYRLAKEIIRCDSEEEKIIDSEIRVGMEKCKAFSLRDYNNLKKTARELEQQVRKVAAAALIAGNGLYGKDATGMFYRTEEGEQIYCSNFPAEIVRDVFVDDGATRSDESERERFFEIETYGGQEKFLIPAAKLEGCEWINKFVSSKAYVMAGKTTKQHFVNAVKECSNPSRHTLFSHTGWTAVEGQMVYLHAGGYLGNGPHRLALAQNTQGSSTAQQGESGNLTKREGNQGSVPSVLSVPNSLSENYSVKLSGNLARYDLSPEVGIDLHDAIRASLRFLDIASDRVTAPLYCANWRALLGKNNFSLHVWGKSGRGKTALCALIQQHHGKTMEADQLPIAWKSTENSIEDFIFRAKDTVVVIDEFKPIGSKNRIEEWHAKADSIFQAIGNGAFRARLNSSLEQRAERRPGALVISTGEDTPKGQSLKARGIIISMNESITTVGSTAQQKLSAAQTEAAQGFYVQVTRAYLEWLAPRILTIQQTLSTTIATERKRLSIAGHPRAGTNTANMLVGIQYFLQFAVDSGAITQAQSDTYLSRCRKALLDIAEEAAEENTYDNPSEQWLRLLRAALASQQAHLSLINGDYPGLEYGWVQSIQPSEMEGREDKHTYSGGGRKIGWIDGEHIYLNPTSAYEAANSIGSKNGSIIALQEATLRKHLDQDGVLASTGKRKKNGKEIKLYTVRRSIGGVQQEVLHLKKSTLLPSGNEEEISLLSETLREEEQGELSNDPTEDSTEHEVSSSCEAPKCRRSIENDTAFNYDAYGNAWCGLHVNRKHFLECGGRLPQPFPGLLAKGQIVRGTRAAWTLFAKSADDITISQALAFIDTISLGGEDGKRPAER